MTPAEQRLERARQELAHSLYKYSGLGAIAFNDLRPEIRELESAVWALAMERPLAVVNDQAEDDGLWFIAATVPESYLQKELRRLHAAIESNALAKEPPK